MAMRDAKRNYIIDNATALFLEKSMSDVTIRDIAKASGVGEATIYRLFSSRRELVISCALKLQEIIGEKFLHSDKFSIGYTRLCLFYNAYLDVFENSPELYCFLSEFDAYCINENVTGLEEYSDNMDKFKNTFFEAYKDGIRDGSVRSVEHPELFYYSTTHAVLSLCKKLAAEGMIIRQDFESDKSNEVRTLIDIILSALKNK